MSGPRPPTCYLHHHVKPCPRCEEQDADLSLSDYLSRMVAGTLTRPGREELAELVREVADVLHSLRTVLATNTRDWSRDKADAWIWGALWGWGALKPGDMDAMRDVASTHGWSDEDAERLNSYARIVANAIDAARAKEGRRG